MRRDGQGRICTITLLKGVLGVKQVVAVYHILADRSKEDVHRELGHSPLGFAAEDGVRLHNQYGLAVVDAKLYLARTCHSQCSNDSIGSLTTIRSEDALDKGHDLCAVKHIELVGLLFKHTGKRELLDSSSPISRGVQDDVCGFRIALRSFDIEDTLAITVSQGRRS